MKIILLFIVILIGCKADQEKNMWQLQWNKETKEVRELLPEKGTIRYLIKKDNSLSGSWMDTTEDELLKNGINIQIIRDNKKNVLIKDLDLLRKE